MALPAGVAASASVVLTLLILAALRLTGAEAFAPLSTSDAAMLRDAEAGYFPLIAAAEAERRAPLAAAAQVQTFGGLFFIFVAGAYGAWRGVSNKRVRGWSNAFWMGSIVAIGLALSSFHGLSAEKIDYLIGSGAPRAPISPLVILLKRGLFGAAFAAFLCILGHDLAYRLRESFVDFGLIEAEEADVRREKRKPFNEKGASQGFWARKEGPGEESASGARAHIAMSSEEASARAVLGVGARASKREIERAFRSQIKRAHPDHGGSVERAAALNAARDLLLGR